MKIISAAHVAENLVVIHGDNLSRVSPSEPLEEIDARIDGVACSVHDDRRSEANFARSRVLHAVPPTPLVEGREYELSLRLPHGEAEARFIGRGELVPSFPIGFPMGGMEIQFVRETLHASDRNSLRPGVVYIESEDFRGDTLIRATSGMIRDVCVLARTVKSCIEVNAPGGVAMKRVRVANQSPSGHGISILHAVDSLFFDVRVSANRCFEFSPRATNIRNTFSFCSGNGIRRGSGIMGRMLGECTTLYECSWNSLDRGVIGQESGSPMRGALIYRCEQRTTGTTLGGSEGILWEATYGGVLRSHVNGRKAILELPPLPRGSGQRIVDPRAGLVYWDVDRETYAIGESVKPPEFRENANGTMEVALDRDFPQGPSHAIYANGAVENTIAMCRAESGCRWVWFFGRSANNHILGGDVRGVYDAVTESDFARRHATDPQTAFAWKNRCYRVRIGPGVVRPRWMYRGYNSSASPSATYPWYREI